MSVLSLKIKYICRLGRTEKREAIQISKHTLKLYGSYIISKSGVKPNFVAPYPSNRVGKVIGFASFTQPTSYLFHNFMIDGLLKHRDSTDVRDLQSGTEPVDL